jgi:uncharacterized membrane protein
MKTFMTTLTIKPNAPITSNPIFTGIGIISKEVICVSGNSVITNGEWNLKANYANQ